MIGGTNVFSALGALLGDANVRDGRMVYVPTKTIRANRPEGKTLAIPLRGPLPDRLALARLQRQAAGAAGIGAFAIDLGAPSGPAPYARPGTTREYDTGVFRRHFREALDLAALDAPRLAGEGTVPRLVPSDLRDTAVTRLHQAKCTKAEIASWHGSDLDTIDSILAHYLDLDAGFADAAGDQLEEWWREAGIAV